MRIVRLGGDAWTRTRRGFRPHGLASRSNTIIARLLLASLTGLEPAFNGLEIRSIIRSGTATFRNGRQGRTRTYGVSNVADLQSAALAT